DDRGRDAGRLVEGAVAAGRAHSDDEAAPQGQRAARPGEPGRRVVVVAHPDDRRAVGRVAGEPAVAEVVRRPRLPRQVALDPLRPATPGPRAGSRWRGARPPGRMEARGEAPCGVNPRSAPGGASPATAFPWRSRTAIRVWTGGRTPPRARVA